MAETQVDLSKLSIRREKGPASVKSGGNLRRWLLVGIVIGIAAVAAWFFLGGSSAVEVETGVVTLTSPSQGNTVLTASGYVVAQRKAAIASKATGRIVYLGYKEGDRVSTNQIIARIESADVEAALAQAKADHRVAQADSVDATQSLERATLLLKRNLIAQADYDAAKARYDRVIASIASRLAAERAAMVQLENTNIRAPFDGTILTKNADVGEVVAPFSAGASSKVAVVTIADMTSLEVEADVSESNIERIRTEQPCEISLDAYPGVRYPGVVDKIVPTADRAKATVMTKIRFVRRDNRVLPEMSAKVYFLTEKTPDSLGTEQALVVDKTALVSRGGRTVTYLLREGKVEERVVTTGKPMGSVTQVLSGLAAGDRVVLSPPEQLHDGSTVRLRQQ